MQTKCGHIFRKVVHIFSDSLMLYISVHWTVSHYHKIWSNKKKWKMLAVPKNKKVDSGNKEGGYIEEVKTLICQCAE